MELLAHAFDYRMADLQWFTINAMKSAFLPFDERLDIIERVVKPGYAALPELALGDAGNGDTEDSPG